MAKRLTRSTSDRMLAGVCGGLAKHIDMDPTVVRLLTVLVGPDHRGAPGADHLRRRRTDSTRGGGGSGLMRSPTWQNFPVDR